MLRGMIRLFELKSGQVYGQDSWDDLRNFGSWTSVIKKMREQVRKHVLENHLFTAELTIYPKLWRSRDGIGTQCLPIPIWRADVVDRENPRLGHKEQLFIDLPKQDMIALEFQSNDRSGLEPVAVFEQKTEEWLLV